MKPNLLFGLISACFLLSSAPQLMAHSAADAESGLRELVGKSAAVAYGKVVDIQYRTSEPTREEPQGVPHTFVTYEIAKVFRGYLPNKITLRIPGGADGNGGAFAVTTTPTFARGEEDVLFIPGGEPGDCQLVDCVEGRFRVLNDRIYSGFGVPLVGAEKALKFGGKPRFEVNTMEMPRPDFQRVIKRPEIIKWLEENKIDARGLEELSKKYEVESPAFYQIALNAEGITKRYDYTSQPEAGVINKYREPLLTHEFFALIEHFNAGLGQPDQRVVLADPKVKFIVKPPVAEMVKDTLITTPRPSEEEIKFRQQPEDSVRRTTTLTPSLTIK